MEVLQHGLPSASVAPLAADASVSRRAGMRGRVDRV